MSVGETGPTETPERLLGDLDWGPSRERPETPVYGSTGNLSSRTCRVVRNLDGA